MDETDGWIIVGTLAAMAVLGILQLRMIRGLQDDVAFLQVVARETDRSMP
jgi:hypothetical protein